MNVCGERRKGVLMGDRSAQLLGTNTLFWVAGQLGYVVR